MTQHIAVNLTLEEVMIVTPATDQMRPFVELSLTEAVGQGKKQRKPLAEIAHRERFGQPFK